VHVFTDLRKVATLYSYIDTEVLQLVAVVPQSVHAAEFMALWNYGMQVPSGVAATALKRP
jgi:hypothetical protein